MANSSTEGKGCFLVALIGGGVLLATVVVMLTWPMLIGAGVVAFGYWIAKKQGVTDQTRTVLVISAVAVLLIASLGEVAWLASRIEAGILPEVQFPATHWIILAALPVVAGLIATITAHVTVRRALAAKV